MAGVPQKFRLSIVRWVGRVRVRVVTWLLDVCHSGINFSVHNNNLNNVVGGILGRVVYVSGGVLPPECVANPMVTLREFSLQFVELLVSTPRWRDVRKLSVSQFVSSYSGRKRTIYEKAAESLRWWGVSWRDSWIKAFLKAEKVDLTNKGNPVPRIISPASPRYNIEIGRYLKHIEHGVYDMIGKMFGGRRLGGRVVMKGLTARQMAREIKLKYDNFEDPVFFGLDCSRFDQHVRQSMLQWEHSIYRAFYPGDEYFAELLNWQLESHCAAYVSDGVVFYDTDGGRCSGHMNTALGNCLIMCALVWTFGMRVGGRFDFIDNGDDGVVICERRDLHKWEGLVAFFLKHGFTLKRESVHSVLEEMEFCQMHPVFDGVDWIMCRDPRKALSKDLVSFDNIQNETQWRQACRLIGQCGLALYGNMPMFGALYSTLERVGRNVDLGSMDGSHLGGLYWLRGKEIVGFSEPTAECRLSFWKAFNIVPDIQEEFEAEVSLASDEYKPSRSGYKLSAARYLSERVL